MTSPLRCAGQHGEDRLGPIQGLNLALLVGAEDQSRLWRVEIEVDDVPHLFDEERVIGELEALDTMRGQCEGSPDSRHLDWESPVALARKRVDQ